MCFFARGFPLADDTKVEDVLEHLNLIRKGQPTHASILLFGFAPLYLTKYIERMGTGTGDMIKRCRNAGLLEPEFTLTDGFVITLRRKPDKAFEAVGGIVTGEVTGEVKKLLMVCRDVMTRKELQENLCLKGEENFRKLYLVPALEAGYIEMTLPDKPQSRLQKYRLTLEGKVLLARLSKKMNSPG